MRRIFFLLGIIVATLLFGFVLPLFSSLKFNFDVSSSKSDWIQNILTLAVISVAIWGKTIKSWFYIPNLIIDGFINNLQLSDGYYQGYTRLLFRNQSSTMAKDVEVYVDRIYDNGVERKNFLQVPLLWTHSGRFIRDFNPYQYAYLDFCVIPNVEKYGGGSGQNAKAMLVLTAGAGVPDYQNIDPGETRINLIINARNGKIKFYEMHLRYKLGDESVTVEKIEPRG